MRILSVVTLVSPDGAYGGPLRVAVNQASELQSRGHDVTIAAACRGYPEGPPRELSGVPARLFPARRLVPGTGFAGLSSPHLLRWVSRTATSFDIVHVHVARDLITLPAAMAVRRRGVPYVLQTHGMINESHNLLARLADPLLTRPVLKNAARLFYLTATERDDLAAIVGRSDALELLTNGVPPSELAADTSTPEILYLARLAPRKRPGLMVDIAKSLAVDHPHYRVRLVGPDEGEAASLETEIAGTQADVRWEGALSPEHTLSRMAQAGIYVLPSIDEPYCMSVLEAMSVGLPVVITNSSGLASVVRSTGAGVVTDPSVQGIIAGVRQIIDNPQLAQQMGQAGRRAAADALGMPAVADKLEQIYEASRQQ